MKKIFAQERQKIILDKLVQQHSITIKELATSLNVSEATLRTDLTKLEQQNQLRRTHGGAILVDSDENETSFSTRQMKNKTEKNAIARAALQTISDNQSIMLDASSTALELAHYLKDFNHRLTVVTSGLKVAMELSDSPNITVILIGGIVKQGSNSLEGTLGADILDKIHVDRLFTSANGFSKDAGFTDFSVYEVELKKRMVQAAKKVTALLDHTKINRSSIAAFASITDIDTFITDELVSEAYSNLFEKHNVELIVAKK